MLPSGNDAAQAICDSLGVLCFRRLRETEPDHFKRLSAKSFSNYGKFFIDEMNKNAQRLGLLSTYYANAHGLASKANQSSALDVAVVAAEGLARFGAFKAAVTAR